MFFLSPQQPIFPKCFKRQSKPNKFCPGCGHSIILKELGYAIDELKIARKCLLGVDIGCSLLAWDFFDINTVQTHHGRTIPVLCGYKTMGPDKIAIAYVGDGGAYAIGLQSLITAAHRNDPITVVVVNNTLYGMTGGQMAPTTLENEVTTTTPAGRSSPPLHGAELIRNVANKSAYVARGIVNNPLELREYLKKAISHPKETNNFAFLEVLSMCPVNWKKDAKESLSFLENEMAKNFKLGEIK